LPLKAMASPWCLYRSAHTQTADVLWRRIISAVSLYQETARSTKEFLGSRGRKLRYHFRKGSSDCTPVIWLLPFVFENCRPWVNKIPQEANKVPDALISSSVRYAYITASSELYVTLSYFGSWMYFERLKKWWLRFIMLDYLRAIVITMRPSLEVFLAKMMHGLCLYSSCGQKTVANSCCLKRDFSLLRSLQELG
jgi:hypothetical protein